MFHRLLAVVLIALCLVAVAGCASVEVEDEERGSFGVSTY